MDSAFKIVGDNGKLQKIISISLILISFIAGIPSSGISYLTKLPKFKCRQKNSQNSEYTSCEYNYENICLESSIYDYIIDKKIQLIIGH